jgi:hypothetical protein
MISMVQTMVQAQDHLQWIETTVMQLRQGCYEKVDWETLFEELEAMGRREKQRLESNLVILLLHLLKWIYQPQKRSGSWRGSIVEHRRRIRNALRDSPSLKPYLQEIFAGCYQDAIEQASAETGLDPDVFPGTCLFSMEDAIGSNFWINL